METIRRDAAGMPYRLVFLGDYVDRGEASAQVIGYLVGLKDAGENDVILLQGNHEQAMLDFIAAPEETLSWIEWGGAQTLESYGIENVLDRPPEVLRDELVDRLPDEHFSFLMGLQSWYRAGDYVFVHAGMKPGVALEEQSDADLLWIREEFFRANPAGFGDICIVHGHTPHEETPLDLGWRINVDTGAFWTGHLTAVALSGTSRYFLST